MLALNFGVQTPCFGPRSAVPFKNHPINVNRGEEMASLWRTSTFQYPCYSDRSPLLNFTTTMAVVQLEPIVARQPRNQLRRPVPKALRALAPAKSNRAASKKTPVSAPNCSANPPASSNHPPDDALDTADHYEDSDNAGDYADGSVKPCAGPSTGGRQPRAATYTTTELNLLLDTISTILPVAPRIGRRWQRATMRMLARGVSERSKTCVPSSTGYVFVHLFVQQLLTIC